MKIYGKELKNMPWEDKPENCNSVFWRYSGNPVIQRDHLSTSNSIFNSAVIPFRDGFAGVFRCDDKARRMRIHSGFSVDGLKWDIEPDQIVFKDCPVEEKFNYAYDPRVTEIDGKFVVTWCNGYYGPTIGVAETTDFKAYYQKENAFLPFNRNGVMFPEKINGNYAMLSRPSDNGHTPFGDIYYSESPDLCFWGKHRYVMGTISETWQGTKIGAGPVPIKTSEGWLLLYHGVLNSCNGFVYSMGAALLDLEEPWKVIARSDTYLLSPQELYECIGDVPNVVFPCAALHDSQTGRIAVYYGAADTTTCIAFSYIQDIIEHIKCESKLCR